MIFQIAFFFIWTLRTFCENKVARRKQDENLAIYINVDENRKTSMSVVE
jgi:hypothetical protein